MKKEELDTILKKLVAVSEKYLDWSIESNKFNKEVAESVAVVLSVAYGRIDLNGSK